MPCPVNKCVGVDHRLCLVELFKTNRIQTLADWEAMIKPVRRKVKARVPKE